VTGGRLSTSGQGDFYYGLVAAAYDPYLAAVDFGDAPFYERLVRQQGGAALELACGTGRLLVPYRVAGLDVEGLDASTEMLARCADKARAAGVTVTLHHAAMESFALSSRYRTLFCPLGSFMLLSEEVAQRAALTTCHEHLEKGGLLALCLDRPSVTPPMAEPRLRREARRTDGALLRAWEQALASDTPGIERWRMTNEVLRDGAVADRESHIMRLRPQPPERMTALLTAAGFAEITLLDDKGERPLRADDESYIAVARRA
jgi:SAM-dependent methyltransferase